MNGKVKFFLSVAICTMFFALTDTGTIVYAHDNVQEDTIVVEGQELQIINDDDVDLVLDQLGLEEEELTEEETVALLTRGTATVWSSTYTNQSNIKKSLSMSAALISSNSRPYTTITITNTGKNAITAIAYKGTVGGSKTIRSMTVAAGSSKSMSVTRSDVLNYGTLNGQGTTSYLTYTVSLYNSSGKAISFKANAVRYD